MLDTKEMQRLLRHNYEINRPGGFADYERKAYATLTTCPYCFTSEADSMHIPACGRRKAKEEAK